MMIMLLSDTSQGKENRREDHVSPILCLLRVHWSVKFLKGNHVKEEDLADIVRMDFNNLSDFCCSLPSSIDCLPCTTLQLRFPLAIVAYFQVSISMWGNLCWQVAICRYFLVSCERNLEFNWTVKRQGKMVPLWFLGDRNLCCPCPPPPS